MAQGDLAKVLEKVYSGYLLKIAPELNKLLLRLIHMILYLSGLNLNIRLINFWKDFRQIAPITDGLRGFLFDLEIWIPFSYIHPQK
ncbi:MAG: hypothetical protein ACE144_01455 [Thermodesulfobacteriota bacterium]